MYQSLILILILIGSYIDSGNYLASTTKQKEYELRKHIND